MYKNIISATYMFVYLFIYIYILPFKKSMFLKVLYAQHIKAAFIWPKYSKNNNMLKYYYNLKLHFYFIIILIGYI